MALIASDYTNGPNHLNHPGPSGGHAPPGRQALDPVSSDQTHGLSCLWTVLSMGCPIGLSYLWTVLLDCPVGLSYLWTALSINGPNHLGFVARVQGRSRQPRGAPAAAVTHARERERERERDTPAAGSNRTTDAAPVAVAAATRLSGTWWARPRPRPPRPGQRSSYSSTTRSAPPTLLAYSCSSGSPQGLQLLQRHDSPASAQNTPPWPAPPFRQRPLLRTSWSAAARTRGLAGWL